MKFYFVFISILLFIITIFFSKMNRVCTHYFLFFDGKAFEYDIKVSKTFDVPIPRYKV